MEITEEMVDTQPEEETIEVDDTDSPDEVEVEDSEEETTEDEPVTFDFGGEDESEDDPSSHMLMDVAALIRTDPDAAIKRVGEVANGLNKALTQRQALAAENEGYKATQEGIGRVMAGLRDGNEEAITHFNQWLEESAGISVLDIADMMGGETPRTVVRKDNSELESLKKQVAELSESASRDRWIAETGGKVADAVAKATGYPVTAQDIYAVRDKLKGQVSEKQVIAAIEQHNPAAMLRYLKAAQEKPGKVAPRAAIVPSGRGGSKQTPTHDSEGFLRAWKAKQTSS